jgi:hypothetical protein
MRENGRGPSVTTPEPRPDHANQCFTLCSVMHPYRVESDVGALVLTLHYGVV